METIIKTVNGLLSVYYNLLGKSAQFNADPELNVWISKISVQLDELQNSPEYKVAIAKQRELYNQTPVHQFLMNSKGKSGFKILTSLNN